jgi:hypothetical protein
MSRRAQRGPLRCNIELPTNRQLAIQFAESIQLSGFKKF